MSDRILVTGATGIVGSELVSLLIGQGMEVKAGTRSPDRARNLFDTGVEIVELDYRQPATFDAAVEWADRVFLQPPPFDADAYETLAPLLDWAVQAGAGHVGTLSAMGMAVRTRFCGPTS
ncbi:MAG: NAD(P)H-binding protein [Thioalkalivibrio sp.]|nr:NAD(P)H-binding protein [Thioalkalivibrio sp.]